MSKTEPVAELKQTVYTKFVSAGICPGCRKHPRSTKSVYCLGCLDKQRKRQQATAIDQAAIKQAEIVRTENKRKAAGLCIGCGLTSDIFADDLCRKCTVSKLFAGGMTRYAAKLQVGLCQRCDAVVPIGTTLCPECLKKRHDLRDERRRNHICAGDCTNPAVEGRKYCEKHIAERKAESDRRREAGLCSAIGCKTPPIVGQRMCEKHQERSRAKSNRKTARRRAEVVIAYGGICSCCHEAGKLFLQVDHVNNDGATHRHSLTGENSGATAKFYLWLRQNNFPKDNFQLLCANCNTGKHRNGGHCPHQDLPPEELQAIRDFNDSRAPALNT